ncbi:MAG: Integral membrane protein (intg_mem_TP0381) [Tenericutes bacterium ADurb.Bin087]|nr:MAG: Integral membrane protein (intg_mem_TP0381) [Tenericutes bacterium ADurb.Bin087]
MFRREGYAEPAGLFTLSHLGLVLFFGALAVLFYALTKKWSKAQVIRFFKIYSLILVALEIFKIIWNIVNYGISAASLNRFIPLYYCSILLYAFVIVAFCKGKVQKAAYSWIMYGGLASGLAFLIYPSSSLLFYPFYHFLCLHSILFHMNFILIGFLIFRHELYIPSVKDFWSFVIFSLVFMILAVIINKIAGTNLMFFEKPLAIGPFEKINDWSPLFFQLLMFVLQLFGPFLGTHAVFYLFSRFTPFKIYKESAPNLTTNNDNL